MTTSNRTLSDDELLSAGNSEEEIIFDDNLKEWQEKIIADLYQEMEAIADG